MGSFGAGEYFIFIWGAFGLLCGCLRGRMSSFGTGVYFIFMQGDFGPLCGWLRENLGSFGEIFFAFSCCFSTF